jgi:hypothetical protein
VFEARDVPAVAFALTANNQILRLDTSSPQTLQSTTAVTGLNAGDTLVGIDFRPANGQLYGVATTTTANTLQVYTINPATGAATTVGTGAAVTGGTIAGATRFSVDVNPVADLIRVVTDLPSDGVGGNVNNLRLSPITGGLAAVDPDLDYSALPAGSAPEVAVAYTNSVDGATSTTLFGIVSGTDRLVTNGGAAPGFNVLADVGPLGADTTTSAALDVFGPGNTALAALTVAGTTRLYAVNTTSGAATAIGTLGAGTTQVIDLAVGPLFDQVAVGGSANGQVQLLTPAGGVVSVGPVVTTFAGLGVNVRSTTGDVNGDGIDDLIAVTGPGTPLRLTVVSGADNSTVLVAPFAPFAGSEDFVGGGFVSAGDFDGDNRDEVVVSPDQGGGPRVTVFSLVGAATTLTVRSNFFGITGDPNFRGGVRTAVGDVNNDGTPDLAVAAGFLGGPRIALFDGDTVLTTPTKLVNDFFAFPEDAATLRNGAFVAIGDLNGDNFGDLIFGGGPGGAPRVYVLSGALVTAGNIAGAYVAPVANFFVAGNATDRGGVRVASADLDGDARDDLIVGSGEGSAARVRVYLGSNITTTAEPTTFQDLTVFGGAVLPGGVFVG